MERAVEVGVHSADPLAAGPGRREMVDQLVAERSVAEHQPGSRRSRGVVLDRTFLPGEREQRVFNRMPAAADRLQADPAQLEPWAAALVVSRELAFKAVTSPPPARMHPGDVAARAIMQRQAPDSRGHVHARIAVLLGGAEHLDTGVQPPRLQEP